MQLIAIALAATVQLSVPVTGRISDSQGGALPGADVLVVCGDQRLTAVTDPSGVFQVSGVPPERCLVVASMSGFLPSRQTVDFSRSTPPLIEFRLGVRPFQADVVVAASRAEEDTTRVPQHATVVDRSDFDRRPYVIITQALKEEAGVLAQQTTASQGSPILRGFTGQRNLYTVDGVRFNTAAWRDGPSQYLAWLPAPGVERLEVIRGPASVQYGSDALGGAVALFTGNPSDGASRVNGELGLAGGTASQMFATHGAVSARSGRLSIYAGGSFSSASDLRAGDGVDSHAAVTRFLGLPPDFVGDRLEGTGFSQSSAFVKLRWQTASTSATGSYRHAEQVDAHRYDQELGGNGRYRSEFGPQALDLAYLRLETLNLGWFDTASATVSINRQDDGRLEQARPGARVDRQSNTTAAYGYQLQGSRVMAQRSLASFGLEIYDEHIAGERFLVEPNGVTTASRPDIPDGTTYRSLGLYWQQTADVMADRLHLRGGLRYGRFNFRTTPAPALGVPEEDLTQSDVTFSGAAVAALSSSWSATASISRGFRAANAFDLGGIGLSGGAGFEISPARAVLLGGYRGSTDGATAVTTGQPVGSLGPESLMAYEAGLRWSSGRANLSVTGFALEFRDAIERRTAIFPSSIVGEDIAGHVVVRQDAAGRAFVAADARPLVTRVNVSRALITGFEADAAVRLSEDWRVRAWASAARGEERETQTPRRRMPPVMGGATLAWQPSHDRWWIEGTTIMAARQARLSDGDLGDARIGAVRTAASIAGFFNGTAVDRGWVLDGRLVETGESLADVQARVLAGAASAPMFTATDGFVAVSLRAGVPLGSLTQLILIGENLTDRNYRLHGSGVDEPGASFHARINIRF